MMWKALDFAFLEHSSISYFKEKKHESPASRWARALTRVAKVGKGLSKSSHAQKLALQHWLEAIDPRHRYGHNLHLYYDVWLDIGEGKEVSLEKCSRTKLQQQCIKYLGPKEREAFEVIVYNGILVYKQSGNLVNTNEGSKWIFVLSTTKALYVGEKKKGSFQHSSFLSGGAISAAGRMVVTEGILKAIWPYSGHYLPREEHFQEFISYLKENDVDLTDVKKCSIDTEDNYPTSTDDSSSENSSKSKPTESQTSQTPKPTETETETRNSSDTESYNITTTTTSSPNPSNDFPGNKIPEKQIHRKWTSGAGPRIRIVRDYPADLQCKALEHVNLSPRLVGSPHGGSKDPIPSPRPSPGVRLSRRLTCVAVPASNNVSLKLLGLN
ncbi:hypothetical protein LUZ60_009304 [Juncus effusus]|nr:hypothetical protein LUZ60_009304 [Juncus effusus]